MAFATLSFSELFRAFTSRSDRYALLQIGLFSNRTMLLAVASSSVLLLLVLYVPLLQPFFDTTPLGLEHWRFVLPLLVVPGIVAELTKSVLRKRKFASA
jgi:Ca2+-transporting ATPase